MTTTAEPGPSGTGSWSFQLAFRGNVRNLAATELVSIFEDALLYASLRYGSIEKHDRFLQI
jgi:hypothetical protein